MYTYLPEIFPVTVNGLALGANSAAGTIGSSISPYVILFSSIMNISPMATLGVVGIVCGLNGLYLKETKGKPL